MKRHSITQRRWPISEISLQQLDGEMYLDFKKYVEKHGGHWVSDHEQSGQLREIHIHFPAGTIYGEFVVSGNYDRYQVTFPDGAFLFWFVCRATKRNSISVPYAYL